MFRLIFSFKGGIRVGDEILEVNGSKLNSHEFAESLRKLEDAMDDQNSVKKLMFRMNFTKRT